MIYVFFVSIGQTRPVHLTSHWAFQLVNDSVDFSRANAFCRSMFSSLVKLDELEEREGALDLLRQTGLYSPIWVKNHNKSRLVALSKQCELKSNT